MTAPPPDPLPRIRCLSVHRLTIPNAGLARPLDSAGSPFFGVDSGLPRLLVSPSNFVIRNVVSLVLSHRRRKDPSVRRKSVTTILLPAR